SHPALAAAAAKLNLNAVNAASFLPDLPPRPGHLTSIAPRVISTEAERSGQSRDSTPNAAEPLSGSSQALPRNHYFVTLDGEPLEIDSPLIGYHQRRHIALAIAAASELRHHSSYELAQNGLKCNNSSYKITNAAIEAGIRN